MSRTTLKPGDLLMIDPIRPGVQAGTLLVAENGVDLMFQFNPRPWKLTAAEAEEVLRGERECPDGGVLYKVWEESTQTSFPPPQSVLDEIERRQAQVEASGEAGESFDKIKPAPVNLDRPSSGLW